MNTETDRIKRVEDFLLDPERALFTTLEEFRAAVNEMLPVIRAIDLNTLATLRGEDGITPQRGKDYMTADDISALEAFILSKMPQTDVDYPSVQATEAFINFQIAKIPRIKGDRGEPGRPGTPGSNGSPDTATDIIRKLRTLGKNQKLQIDDIRGLEERIRIYNDAVDELAQLREDFNNQRIVVPANMGTGGGAAPGATAWGSITGLLSAQTDLQTALDLKYDDTNPASYISDITGKVSAGANVTITGLGTTASPYVINSSAVGGGAVWGAITGTLSDQADLQAALDAKADDLTADQNYVSDAQLVVITNTSGVNTGDNTNFAPPLGADDNYVTDAEKVKLANLSGTNTGDQDLSTYVTLTGAEVLSNKTLTAPIINAGTIGTSLVPTTNDGAALGSTTNQFSDLFLAEGGVINWDNSDATLTQVNNVITMAGADLRATTNGTNAASVMTVGGAQSFANKNVAPGALTLEENAAIALDPVLSADGTYSGTTITGVAGTTLAFGDLVYLAVADSRWELVDADAVATSDRMIGICVLAAGADGNATNILLVGNIRADAKFPALTIGAAVYAGETPGEIQVAIPTGADAVIRRIGYALTADSIYFNPSMDSQTTIA